jgi:superoxide reductase
MAIAKSQVYKCSVCGNEVEVIYAGGGTLVCCQKNMDLLTENTTDAAQEKHVPVIERVEGGVKVKVGSVAHPMEEAHLIQWIELIADGKAYRHSLSAGDPAETVFPVEGENLAVRAYCNLHGLWKAA